MQQAVSARTPAHLWIVGILSLLWNCFGAYDYTMTRMRNTDYIAKAMPGVDPNAALAWIDSMPMYAQVGWGLGVWLGLLGAVLLLAAQPLGGVVLRHFVRRRRAQPRLPDRARAATRRRQRPDDDRDALCHHPRSPRSSLWYAWSMEKKGLLR